MHTFKLFSVVLIGLAALPAFAYSCRDYKGRSEIRITGMADRKPDTDCVPKLNELLFKPTVFYFQSPGGYIDRIDEFVSGMTKVFAIARNRSGTLPIVVIHTECKSACIPILAGFNQLAKDQKIALVVEPKTEIGFHGCSDEYAEEPVLRFTIEGTNRYLKYFVKQGGSLDWITEHIQIFNSPKIVDFYPADPELANSGILNYASIVSFY